MLPSLLLTFLSLAAPVVSSPVSPVGIDEIGQEELDRLVAEIQSQIEELRGQPFRHPVAASVTVSESVTVAEPEPVPGCLQGP